MTTDHDNSWAASSHLPPSISPTTHGEEEEEDARIYRLAAGPRTCDRPPLALLSLNPRPMRSGTRLLGVGVAAAAVVCAWLASCSRAFPFPIPLLEPYTSQKDGERSLPPFTTAASVSAADPTCLRSAQYTHISDTALPEKLSSVTARCSRCHQRPVCGPGLAGPRRRLDGIGRRPLPGGVAGGAVRRPQRDRNVSLHAGSAHRPPAQRDRSVQFTDVPCVSTCLTETSEVQACGGS